MTDNEIIKALDDVGTSTGVILGHHSGQADIIADRFRELLDENNRLNAEIERLEKEIENSNKQYPCTVKMSDYCLVYTRSLDDYDKLIDEIKSEAIKEFAEKLKENVFYANYCGIGEFAGKVVSVEDIDNLVEEMTEVEK